MKQKTGDKIHRRHILSTDTFHGRDVYAYTAARLASGKIQFDAVGPALPDTVIRLAYQKASLMGDSIIGNIPILDIQYGNVWTNIPDSLLHGMGIKPGDDLSIFIWKEDSLIYSGQMPYVSTFGEVAEGKALSYSNSLLNISFALNMGNFSDSLKIGSGPEWNVTVKKTRVGK